MRLLGIPTVRDRVVQATLKLLLEPIFDPHFSPNSYGFRPGRSQHQAVEAAQRIVNSGKPYVVDIDLSKFFDRIHHDRLIARMGQKVTDKRILRLVGLMLRSGIMINGVVNPSQEGAMQGGPFTPLTQRITFIDLCRIVLDRRFLRLRIASCWRCLPWYGMFNRNQIFSHNDLLNQQPHNSLALTHIEGIGI